MELVLLGDSALPCMNAADGWALPLLCWTENSQVVRCGLHTQKLYLFSECFPPVSFTRGNGMICG